jgi:ubiquinone/menaquinone biosynthesis C-methylase UbiE
MKRSFTNKIRYLMDEFIPPVIRDSKWFMRIFYMLAYKKIDVQNIMNFKTHVWSMTTEEYDNFYSSLNSISRNRLTDINDKCLSKIKEAASVNVQHFLDVGCGGGFLLKYLKENSNIKELYGTDLFESHSSDEFIYKKAHADQLPFENHSIDLVNCSHVLEHLKNPKEAIQEILRVAKKKIIVVVPCQRPFFYTLDEHINFFTYADQLIQLIGLKNFSCEIVDGDWIYIGNLDE